MISIVIFLIVLSVKVMAVDIGSDTAVTRFNTQQTVNDGDRIAGFAALEGGFVLADSAVTGFFDSFFSVSGDIDLRGGTLVLLRDLIFSNNVRLRNLGNVVGNNHTLDVFGAQKIPFFDFNCFYEFITTIAFGIDNTCVDWAFDNTYIAFGFDFGASSGVAVLEFNGATLVLSDFIVVPTGAVQVNSVRWRPGEYLIAMVRDQNATSELDIVDFAPGGPTLSLVDSLNIATDNITACAWRPDGAYLAIGGDVPSAQLSVIPVDGAGNLDVGNIVTVAITPDRAVQLEALDWDPTGNFLAVGVADIGSESDLLIYEFVPLPTNTLTLNAEIDLGFSVLSTSFNPTFTQRVAASLSTGASEQIQLFEYDNGGGGAGAGSLTKISSITDLEAQAQSIEWTPDGGCLTVGRDIFGGTGALRTYAINQNTFEFFLQTDLATTNDVVSISNSPNGQLITTAQGVVGASDNSVYELLDFGATQYTWSNVNLELGSLNSWNDCTITFTGASIVDGKGGTLTLGDSCKLFVEDSSTLTFRDITIKGVNSDVIQPIDTTSTIFFDNVKLILDGTYSFTLGHFEVNNVLRISGEGFQFNYQTDLVSSFTTNTSLIIDRGVVFNYDPPISNQNLLNFEDDTASLYLLGGTLQSSNVGLQLTKCRVFFDKLSYLSNQGSSLAQAIIFGDGISTANNVCVEFMPATNVVLQQGFFRNANV